LLLHARGGLRPRGRSCGCARPPLRGGARCARGPSGLTARRAPRFCLLASLQVTKPSRQKIKTGISKKQPQPGQIPGKRTASCRVSKTVSGVLYIYYKSRVPGIDRGRVHARPTTGRSAMLCTGHRRTSGPRARVPSPPRKGAEWPKGGAGVSGDALDIVGYRAGPVS
jgi:hypothetical protein